jgi:thiol-disulfide isomerase/thioredoxin
MTGFWVVGVAVLLALGFGLYRKAVDGRVVASRRRAGLDSARLGESLGDRATFVQFSTQFCAPCRVAGRVLGEVTAATTGVSHIEVDAEQRLDLVEELGITRTPTVLLVDGEGVVRNRIVGAPRKQDVQRALDELLDRQESSL